MDERLQQNILTQFQQLFGDRVTDDEIIRGEHGAGFSYHDCMPPDWVVYPESTDEVVRVISIAAQHQIPVIPFGAGTSVEGHVSALQGGVCIDLRKMNKVLEVNFDDMYVAIQAGVTRNQLDALLEGSG